MDVTDKNISDYRRILKNYRGRRYIACRAIDQVKDVIENLGIEDGRVLPIPDKIPPFNPVPDQKVRAELKNIATSLLRLILILNDGQVSNDKLNAF